MPLVTFPLAALDLVQSGQKTATIRFDDRLRTARPGQTLTMQFGARNNPTTLRATLTEVQELPVLEWLASLLAFDPRFLLDDLQAELSAGSDFEQSLVRACDASSTVLLDLIEDCRATGRSALVLHFKL
ncbi:hypothetical protein [Deinococcus peraridilitoris]|uniref:ASCH domain-containing protein n=1 Tax=Deinococcus peraridilitoris (strain DSM 19664 / LMG 22246 / CIP 109416 / KR-200) TaxID=937777 RepID=K9ZZ48_DEIPD|nr:hypothetical protein [Deinococcus peraridilitoris]AFZ66923.1 hypothetical protein Deipe_1377 [Deinococcus peraridilitoris DSM 19664]